MQRLMTIVIGGAAGLAIAAGVAFAATAVNGRSSSGIEAGRISSAAGISGAVASGPSANDALPAHTTVGLDGNAASAVKAFTPTGAIGSAMAKVRASSSAPAATNRGDISAHAGSSGTTSQASASGTTVRSA